MKSRLKQLLLILTLAAPLAAQTSGNEEISRLKAEVAEQKAELAKVRALLEQLAKQDKGTVVSPEQKPSATVAAPAAVAKAVNETVETVSRFRPTGDIRIRYENFNQGCALCTTRHRERIRVRFGFEGKLGEDFIGGVALATGSSLDPISTNETLTNFFERKTIGLDKAYVTYNPSAHKWLSLTAGKFAYTWNRSPLSFDADLTPEGASEKFAFDLKSTGALKKVSFTAMQLLFNEVAGPNGAQGLGTGADSFAAGGQVSAVFSFGKNKRVTLTPSYTLLNWRNTDAIAQAYLRANQAATASGTLNPSGTTSALASSNSNTNATIVTGSGTSAVARFRSKFLYSDLMLVADIKTKYPKYPITVTLNYLQNLRAARSLITGTAQDKAYWAELGVGRAKERGDWLFSYAFARVEQDSVIAAFTESDKRAGTNVVQNRFLVSYQFSPRVSLGYTGWIGRTLNPALPNSALAPGRTGAMTDPWLFRSMVDLTYKF